MDNHYYRFRWVLCVATSVFEGRPYALSWLARPQPGLNGGIPFKFLRNDLGTERVLALLTQIEYGILT